MEITTAYSFQAKPICWISIGFDRGRFVISPKRDVTASHPDSYMVGPKTGWAPKHSVSSAEIDSLPDSYSYTVGAKNKLSLANIQCMRDYRPIPNRLMLL